MKTVYGLAVLGLALLFSTNEASAQYPSYGGFGQGYSRHHSHHDHHYVAPQQSYGQGYGSGIPSYGYNSQFSQPYSSNYGYPQTGIPQVSSYYSNNYYGRPAHSHHSWHPGHYLSGHH